MEVSATPHEGGSVQYAPAIGRIRRLARQRAAKHAGVGGGGALPTPTTTAGRNNLEDVYKKAVYFDPI